MTLLLVEQAAVTTAVEATREIAATAVARPKDEEDLISFAVETELDRLRCLERGESMKCKEDGASGN